jgi:hypothetical protein
MKDELLALTRAQVADLAAVSKAIKAAPTARIKQRALLDAGAAAARRWFDIVRPALERAVFPSDAIAGYSARFEALLAMTRGQPMKAAYLKAVSDISAPYVSDIVHHIEIGSFTSVSGLSIAPYIEGLPIDEGDYLDEAQRCLSAQGLRACIVLGWCATVARIHRKIEEIGFDKFSKATEEMKAKTTGRFKPFTKTYSIESLSELQRIFDTDILFILEYLQLIDSNQHARLRHCFDMRNHSAHPGQAPITGENLYSFFSDITQIVLKNSKFEPKPIPPFAWSPSTSHHPSSAMPFHSIVPLPCGFA